MYLLTCMLFITCTQETQLYRCHLPHAMRRKRPDVHRDTLQSLCKGWMHPVPCQHPCLNGRPLYAGVGRGSYENFNELVIDQNCSYVRGGCAGGKRGKKRGGHGRSRDEAAMAEQEGEAATADLSPAERAKRRR